MRKRIGRLLVVAGVVVGIVSLVVTSTAQEADLEVGTPRLQTRVETIPELDNRLEPVAAEVTVSSPPISADEALQVAFAEGYGEAGATSVTRTLTSFTSGIKAVADGYPEGEAPTTLLYENHLAWVLEFRGVCVDVYGAPGQDMPKCAGTEISVVIDAGTGKYIEAYSAGM